MIILTSHWQCFLGVYCLSSLCNLGTHSLSDVQQVKIPPPILWILQLTNNSALCRREAFCCRSFVCLFVYVFASQSKFFLSPLFSSLSPLSHSLLLHCFSSNTGRPPMAMVYQVAGTLASPLLLGLDGGMGPQSRQHSQRQLLLPPLGVSHEEQAAQL